MTPHDIRNAFIAYYCAHGHVEIPSDSLVPQNDPTTLFTGSGMQPLVPYLLGKDHPEGLRLVNSQKCFRSMDIEEVGDNRHTTFFEMLGNWSLGDYFKDKQLPWIFHFLTDELGLDPSRLYVTVFAGDPEAGIARDDESVEIWKRLFAEKGIEAKEVLIGSEADGYEKGMQGGRIFYYDASKNWWSRAGVPANMPAGEPGGPDSEIFYDFYPELGDRCLSDAYGPYTHPNSDCGRFLEIANSVFMQFLKQPDGSFAPLPKRNVDFGGGLERLAMAVHNNPDIVAVNHRPILDHLEQVTGKSYKLNAEHTRAFRIIADHMKAAVFLIADGVRPGNTDQGYFVRRLIRRSVRYADLLGMQPNSFAQIVRPIADMYASKYPEVSEQANEIEQLIAEEEQRFRTTLARGLKEFDRATAGSTTLSGSDAFTLFSTYGFPIEMTVELAAEKGISVDEAGFREEMGRHQSLSRAGSEQKFKGGLADASVATTRLHTAHHLLLRALQKVLGDDVKQRGSNITAERMRMDFSYDAKLTPEQKAEVEKIVNETIEAKLPVIHSVMPKEAAMQLGAQMEFGTKYPDQVSVYSVGPEGATPEDPRFDEAFSIEFCGGPHVSNTSELGAFSIKKEEASSAGVRRIKATLTPPTNT